MFFSGVPSADVSLRHLISGVMWVVEAKSLISVKSVVNRVLMTCVRDVSLILTRERTY